MTTDNAACAPTSAPGQVSVTTRVVRSTTWRECHVGLRHLNDINTLRCHGLAMFSLNRCVLSPPGDVALVAVGFWVVIARIYGIVLAAQTANVEE